MLGELWQQLCSQAKALRQWALAACLIFIVASSVFRTYLFYRNRPRNLLIYGSSLRWGKWLSSVQYVFNAPHLIDTAYEKAKGKPFVLPALSEYQVFVSSEAHLRELNESPQDHLSLHEVMEDRVKHKYTMYGFEQGDIDPHDTVPGRVLKLLLRTNMPGLRTRIMRRIEQAYDQVLSKGKASNDGWNEVSVFELAEAISLRMNCQVIAGDQLADNEDYVNAVKQYSRDAVLSMELSRYMPSFLVSYTCLGIMAWSGAVRKIARYLTLAVERRLEELQLDEKMPTMDCISWVIESSKTPQQRSVQRIVQQLIALIFASAHQIPMVTVFAMYNLCLHPEYIEPLREEARRMLELPPEDRYKTMPLLESFLRESARMNPLDSLSVQRKVMKPFTFSDGSHVPAGNIICVPQQALMQDGRYYRDPAKFDAFRFVVPEAQHPDEPVTKYTDVTSSFPFWGASKKACPGRWYVSAALKQILSHLLMDYEFRLSDPHAPLTFAYTTMVIPRHSTKILLRRAAASPKKCF